MAKQLRSAQEQQAAPGQSDQAQAAGPGAGRGNQAMIARMKGAKGTGETPEAIIKRYTNFGGFNLQEDLLGRYLLTLLPSRASLVLRTLDTLGNSDRDDVAYYMAVNASDERLKAIASSGLGSLLFKLAAYMQGGPTSSDEAKQMERLVRCASPTHQALKDEEASKDPKVEKGLEAEGATLQSISDGSGDYIYDEYSVIIDSMPPGMSPEEFLAEMATDINKTVNDTFFDGINVFKRRETTPTPEVGNIYDIDIGGPDNGSVVLVKSTSSYFVFQTVTTSKTGTHPEYGSRQFGFDRLADGGIKFYTRGASRSANALYCKVGPIPQAIGWTSMMHGISDAVKDRGGKPRPNSVKKWTTHQ